MPLRLVTPEQAVAHLASQTTVSGTGIFSGEAGALEKFSQTLTQSVSNLEENNAKKLEAVSLASAVNTFLMNLNSLKRAYDDYNQNQTKVLMGQITNRLNTLQERIDTYKEQYPQDFAANGPFADFNNTWYNTIFTQGGEILDFADMSDKRVIPVNLPYAAVMEGDPQPQPVQNAGQEPVAQDFTLPKFEEGQTFAQWYQQNLIFFIL